MTRYSHARARFHKSLNQLAFDRPCGRIDLPRKALVGGANVGDAESNMALRVARHVEATLFVRLPLLLVRW